jgi:6-phospho-3-hexuloisomerase
VNLKENFQQILVEQQSILEKTDFEQVAKIIPFLKSANSIFVVAAGRSGLAIRSAAMRLMHFGFKVYVVGETTTPAIKEGDLLITASGSGTTSSIVKAVAAKAKVVTFSTTNDSPLAKNSDLLMIIPAAQKQDHGKSISSQYSGSLFEQALLLLTDAIFQTLWDEQGTPAEELWKKHANLE